MALCCYIASLRRYHLIHVTMVARRTCGTSCVVAKGLRRKPKPSKRRHSWKLSRMRSGGVLSQKIASKPAAAEGTLALRLLPVADNNENLVRSTRHSLLVPPHFISLGMPILLFSFVGVANSQRRRS